MGWVTLQGAIGQLLVEGVWLTIGDAVGVDVHGEQAAGGPRGGATEIRTAHAGALDEEDCRKALGFGIRGAGKIAGDWSADRLHLHIEGLDARWWCVHGGHGGLERNGGELRF